MNEFSGIVEGLLIKLIAINYKINDDLPLNKSDREQMEIIKRCASLYNTLNSSLKLKKYEDKNDADVKLGNMYGIFDTANDSDDLGADDFSGFSDYSDQSDNSGEVKINIKTDTKVEEPVIDEPITYETDPELIEICKENKIKFDELTKKLLINLNTVQDSFWTTIDVK